MLPSRSHAAHAGTVRTDRRSVLPGLAALALWTVLAIAPAGAQSGPPVVEGGLEIVAVNGEPASLVADPGDVDDAGADGIVGNEIERGDEVRFRAGGYEPGATVEIWLFSDPVLLDVVVADSEGFIEVAVAIPEDAELGEHTLRATGPSPTGEVLTLAQPVEVRAGGGGAVADDAGPPGALLALLSAGIALLVGVLAVRATRSRAA